MKIIRAYYDSSEAANLLGCDEKDLYHLAFERKIKLGIVFPEMLKEFGFTSRFYIANESEFEKWLMSSELGAYNDRQVCGASYVQVISPKLLRDNDGLYFTGWMKEYWNCDQGYLSAYYEHSYYPEEWPTYFYPDFGRESCCITKVIPNYCDVEDNENYFFQQEVYITGKELEVLKSTLFNTDMTPKINIQSNVQKERHAVPRVEVLMALVSLYHQGLNIRKENATQLTELLWKRSGEFWPDRKEPPLKFETVRDLISDAIKGPVFNN